jgi:spermidine synthase
MESLKAFLARLFIFTLGMTAMAAQVIMIRESLAVFHANELIIGLFLGIWMGLTALGAFLASRQRHCPLSKSKIENRKQKIENPFSPLLLLSFSLLPLVTLFLIVTLRYSFIPSGTMPGLGMTALVMFLALLPFCLVSGMLFPILVKELSALKENNLLHEGYALDSAGSILGGVLFSFFFIFRLPPYESLILLTVFCMLILFIMSAILKRTVPAITTLILGLLIFLLPTIPAIVRFLDDKQFNSQDVIEIRSSPHGLLAVSKMDDQLFIYENGIPVSLGDDPYLREESVHYAMLLHHSPETVLAISGTTSGLISEVLKYPGTSLDCVEPNPWLIRLVNKYRPLPQSKSVNYIYKDPKIFLAKTEKKYDIILVNTPEPNSADLNRFYTVEFYRLLKDKLNPRGILSVSIPSAGNYMNETSRQVHSVTYNTMKAVFSQVRIIPGAKDYFLASDSTVEQSIFTDYRSKGIENDYVNPYYINETLLKMRNDLLMKGLLPDERVNTDLRPYVFSLFLRQWLERFEMNNWLMPLILILILTLSLIFLGPLNLGLFAGGFTASSLEFLLLIWFQVIYGNVYHMTGVIFAVFMLGLALGSLALGNRYWVLGIRSIKLNFKSFLIIQGINALFSASVALIILLFSQSRGLMVSWSPILLLILFLVFTTGFLTGLQFSLSAHLRKTDVLKSSGESFSADLLGSAIGILMVSVYVIPQMGLPATALALAGLNTLVLGVIAWKK